MQKIILLFLLIVLLTGCSTIRLDDKELLAFSERNNLSAQCVKYINTDFNGLNFSDSLEEYKGFLIRNCNLSDVPQCGDPVKNAAVSGVAELTIAMVTGAPNLVGNSKSKYCDFARKNNLSYTCARNIMRHGEIILKRQALQECEFLNIACLSNKANQRDEILKKQVIEQCSLNIMQESENEK